MKKTTEHAQQTKWTPKRQTDFHQEGHNRYKNKSKLRTKTLPPAIRTEMNFFNLLIRTVLFWIMLTHNSKLSDKDQLST